MNQKTEIKKLLHKFVLNQCSAKEIEIVVSYFNENKLSDDFPTVEEVLELLENIPEMDESTAHSIYSQIIVSQKTKEKEVLNKSIKIRRIWKYASVAAVFLLFIGLGYIYRQVLFSEAPTNNISAENYITLQLEDGSIKVISEEENAQILNASGNVIGTQKGRILVYDNTTESEKLAYNTLKVPYGKRFEIKLSDGTTAHLNAGTSLKYPAKFIKGKNRQVYLTGEAFFDVVRDIEHPFVVNSDKLNVRVLGTKFNISSYPEDYSTDVVLVEGSVGMYTNGNDFNVEENTVLEAGYKGTFNKKENSIITKKVVTDIYSSWVNGELVFRNMAFKNILKKMERHYNIAIINENVELSNEIFNASFSDVPIEKILEYLKITYTIDFDINGNQITIK